MIEQGVARERKSSDWDLVDRKVFLCVGALFRSTLGELRLITADQGVSSLRNSSDVTW